MRRIGLVLLLLLPAMAMAAVTGTVVNRSTGKPQAGAVVGLNRLGGGGIELIDQATSDAQGKFTINRDIQGPHVLRTAFDGVTYNHMLPPGSPTTDLTLDVYPASKQPGAAKVSKHMLMFSPSGGQLTIEETYLYSNDGTTAWNDPDNGTLHFYLPAAAGGKVQVNATAPGGMPIPAAVDKTSKADIYKVDFAVKPGETRFDVTYAVPHTEGSAYEGKIVTKDDNTYLIAPTGVTLTGANLSDMGQEPRSQAHIYGLQGDTYKIELAGAAAPPQNAEAGDQQDNGPAVEQIMPRLYSQATPLLALALGILALGFILLYRAPTPGGQPATPAKEKNERARR